MPPDPLPILAFRTPAAWAAWLRKHHADAPGVLLRLYKKDSGEPSVTYAQALDEALCHGWIDGVKRAYDAQSWLQRFTPRRPRSAWSQVNVGHVARLTQEGRMQPAGLAAVEAAKKDGRWAKAYASSKDMTVPADFLRALQKDKKAHAFFKTLNKANVYAIAYRLQDAKKPETRERRMKQFLEMLAEGRKLH